MLSTIFTLRDPKALSALLYIIPVPLPSYYTLSVSDNPASTHQSLSYSSLLNLTMWYQFSKFLLIEALLSFLHGKSLVSLRGHPPSVPDSGDVLLIIRIKGSHGVLQVHSLDFECPPGPVNVQCYIEDSLVTQHVWVPLAKTVDWIPQGDAAMTTVTLTATIVTVVDTIFDTTTTITETPLPTYTNSLGTRTQRITYITDGSTVTTDL